MESFENFMEIFSKRKIEKNDDDLKIILKNGSSHFKNLSTNDIDLVLSIFLNDKTGLLKFLDDASNKDMENSIVEGFKLLSFTIDNFHRLLDEYLIKIEGVCRSAIIKKCSHYVKNAAIECFENLLKMCPGNKFDLKTTVTTFIEKFHLCNNSERAKLLKALGVIAKYHPESITHAKSREIFGRVINDFDERYSKMAQGSQPSEIAIYLEVLNNLLKNFTPQKSHERSKSYYKKIYAHVKNLSSINTDQKLKFVSRAAIELLGQHMPLFDEYVYEDAKFWHTTLLNWTRLQGDNGLVGFKTLSVYYERMGVILKEEKNENGRKIFEYLKEFFENEFIKDSDQSATLQLSICGFGHMAAPCKNYLTEKDVEQMFALLAQRAMIVYTKSNSTKGSIENIAYYQVALSEIMLEMTLISRDQLDTIIKLSLILVKQFPDVPITSISVTVKLLMKTIFNIRKACRRSYEEFIQRLVYEGIMWSCSHTLFIDAEREREMKDSDECPVSYKNYLTLWQPLIGQNKIIDEESSTISKEIFNNMIETCVKLIKKLNLDVKNVDVSSETESLDIPLAVNDTDFRVFVNLVDLFQSILEKAEPALMEANNDWFITEIIKKSNQNPLISGFYKLVLVVLKLCDSLSDKRKKKFTNQTLKLVSQYLSDTIERLPSFSGELQASCFNMIFEIPVSIAREMLDGLVPVFDTAFSLGQSNFGLAQSALSTLERWTETMDKYEMRDFLIAVIPGLEHFLQSDESAVEFTDEILKKRGRSKKKNIVLADLENTLPEFQKRVLLLFGSLNSDVILNIASVENFNNETLRDDKYLLKYKLLYRDIRPDIYLDTILRRTIQLALHSTDRRTRVLACEVLHSIIIVVLQRTMEYLSSNPDRLLPLFKIICPAVLRLGSDSDQVIQQLYYPLTIQLTHWYSSKMMLKSSETVCLIDTLFELLTYESNMALTDFCGVCLAEFVKWSIKQSSDGELQRSDTNMEIILMKISNFAKHPLVRNRIGAAVAFNYLYTILREYDIIVDIYWLELFFCFIKSLDGCNSTEIFKSLKHIEKVIFIKSEILNRVSSKRKKPTEFKGSLLKDAAYWLVEQCGSLDCHYRSKSMEFLAAVSKSIPEFSSIQNFFLDYLNSNGMRGLNGIILKGLYPKMDTLTEETMNPLLRTLDCYVWIIGENIITLDSIFTDKNTSKDMIFNCVINFIYLVNVKNENNDEFSTFNKKNRALRALKCKIILKIFDFVWILLERMDSQEVANSSSYIPKFFWNDELFTLISTAVFKPHAVGFDSQNLELTESLPSKIQQLLVKLIQKFDDKHLLQLRESIARDIKNKYEEFLNFDRILNIDPSIELKNYLKGLIMLGSCDKFGKLYEIPIDDNSSVEKVMEIYRASFNSLKTERDDTVACIELESSVKEYLNNLLEFLFLKFNPKMVLTLLNIVETKRESKEDNSVVIFHGEYFTNIFGLPIYRYLLKHINESMDTLLDESLKSRFDAVLKLLEDLLVCVKNNRRTYQEFLSSLEIELLNRFPNFRRLINSNDQRKEKLINIYSFIVQISKDPFHICHESDELYSWIMRELFSYLDLEYKTRILNNFLPCIVGENEHKKRELERCLRRLKSDFYSVDIKDLDKGSLQHSNLIANFKTLTHHLPSSKSITFFDCLVYISIGNVEYLWDDDSTKYLIAYFREISAESSKESLKILYKYFLDTDNAKSRLEILKNLLLKCIHFCNANVIEKFYEDNVKEIYDIVIKDISGTGYAFKNSIVSKIGAYNLLEIMFAEVKFEKISSTESQIVKNAIESIETGKELFQALNSSALNVRKLKIQSEDIESKELIRLLHCAAYNCSVSIVSLKNEEAFYVLPFFENKKAGSLIWENIIDINRKYQFKEDFKETPKEYKKLINIRRQCNLNKAHSYSYLKSYDLATSTLNEDLACFDLYESKLEAHSVTENNYEQEMMSLTFEFDDINNHECMAPICGVITHMVSANISRLPDEGENLPIPKWMQCFQNSFNGTVIENVKLFMVKIILNMQEVFKPFGKFFIVPILRFLNLQLGNYRVINYVVKDVVVMLIDWHSVAVPSDKYEKRLAQQFFELLMRYGDSKQTQINRYNVELINTLVEVWKSCLEVPQGILSIQDASKKFTVRMILIFVFNKKEESISRRDILLYLTNLLDDSDEKMILDVCNGLGCILDYLESKKDDESKKFIIEKIKSSVIEKSHENYNKYIKCIYEIQKFYKKITDYCYSQLMLNFSKIEDSNKEKCLELFLSALPNFTDREIITELGYIKFKDIMKNKKVLTCENVALKIVEKLLNILNASDYLPFALLTVPYSKDVPLEQREIVMDIFIAVHRKYSDNIDDDIAVSELRDLSKRILLLGLLDPNESLQNKLLKFWSNDGNIAEMPIERMLELFEMYDINLESSYLPILPLMMLHLVSKDPEFEKKMFGPLKACKFEDYHIAIQWRFKQAALAAPLFTSSFASQISRYYSQSNPTFARFNQSLQQSSFLRATRSPQFEQTLPTREESSFQTPGSSTFRSTYTNSGTEKIPQPSKNKKSERLLRNTTNLRTDIRHKQISKNLRRDEILKQGADRQRESIKIYRKYRIGDYPDTEITHSSLIKPLQELVKNDQIIARELTVEIFRSMLKEMSSDRRKEFLQKLSKSLNVILDNSRGSKPLIATVLEIILNSEEIRVSPNVIERVSKSSGLFSLSALLLEEKIISVKLTEDLEPVNKKSKLEAEVYGEEDNWLQLASIYKSMDDLDIVQSIFGYEKFGKELQEASLAQAASKWSVARDAYKKAYEINEGLVRDYCQESLFTCLAYMSDWKTINQYIKSEYDEDFNALWQKPLNENWMASWTLQAQIQKIVENDCDEKFLEAFSNWLNDKEKLFELKKFYGEEVAVFFIDQNPKFSKSCLRSGLEKVINEWKHLNPLNFEQKINNYIKLRGLSDVNTYLKGVNDEKPMIPDLKYMLNVWNNNVPANRDNLLLWDKHIAYRLYFFGLLREKFSDEESDEESPTLDLLSEAIVRQCLNVVRVACSQSNMHFMKKYLRYSEPYFKSDNSNLSNEWKLSTAKYKYLCYNEFRSNEKRSKSFITSWEMSHEIIEYDNLSSKLKIDVIQHIGDLLIELQKLVIEPKPVGEILIKNQLILERLDPSNGRDSILKQLVDSCLNRLKECYELTDAANKAKSYFKVSKYCHSMSTNLNENIDLSKDFVYSTIRAMSYGSQEASHYFPCLLNLEYCKNSELSETFKREIDKVETWMFIKWQAQLLSHIDTPICPLIAPTLLRLAESYPNSFIYTFRVTKEMNKAISRHEILMKLSEILSENKDLELFLEAVNYLVQPELYLIHHISKLELNSASDAKAVLDALLNTVYPTIVENDKFPVKGKVYERIKKFETRIKEAENKKGEELISHMKLIVNDLNRSVERISTGRKPSLEDYSPWLYNFTGGNIEIPGQYTGEVKPLPQYHAKIVKLNSSVTVLPSLRKPIKITMLGNDGKNYNFLVKFGEDLRMDERIEQLFTLMNKILKEDANCRYRRLSIDTYLVIPLTGYLGLIQWVDDTKSLNEVLDSALTEDQKKERKTTIELYLKWINDPASLSIELKYKKALLKYGREAATRKFDYLKNRIRWDGLREAFKRLSSSPESFFALRQNFTTSYATICIAHWILGVGDRNLSNILISYKSGKALGIDFGYSFDATVDSSVPELMPFRLTPQIIGLLKPFDENGLLKITMINVLRALKHGKDPLIACMDIFIREPSLDWLATKKSRLNRQEDSDARWYPKQKIKIVIDKLNGAKPSKLTLLQIKDRYGETEYFREYIEVINGSADGLQSRVRSKRKDDDLSVEEQVECLLDQATDPNILARTWYGWEPWI